MESSKKIALPCDAEGREIPLDTEVLYEKEGDELRVKRVEFDVFSGSWCFAVKKDSIALASLYRRPQDVYLVKPAPPDSWEKLLDDLDNVANGAKGGYNPPCCHARRESIEVDAKCLGCRLYETDGEFVECHYLAYANIADRIRKLRGEDELQRPSI